MNVGRLSNYKLRFVPTSNRNVHLFEGVPASYPRNPRDPYDGRRFFARVLIRKLDSAEISDNNSLNTSAYPEMETAFVEALNSIAMSVAGNYRKWRYHHIFINVLKVEGKGPTQEFVESWIRLLGKRYADKIRRLDVSTFELAISLQNKDYRIVGQAPTREVLNVNSYQVVNNKLKYLGNTPAELRFPDLEGERADAPYSVCLPLQQKREAAWRAHTAYCYDFLPIMRQAIRKRWWRYFRSQGMAEAKIKASIPEDLFEASELVLGPDGNAVPTERPIGQNDIGMVAWIIEYKSIEYPEGREIVIIANDISFQVGTFGVQEDNLYNAASRYARDLGIPRIYLAANSGARIGLAEELRDKFQVAWNNDNVSKGMEYLYLSEEDYAEHKDTVIADKRVVKGEIRYELKDIIGASEGLGVENLSGSGLIAGETSQAYEDIYTLTVVTGRSVGIGAYLARLGQRVIQKKKESPILLTGFNALNKLLGRRVYRSNDQLGGIDIMYSNGISHLVFESDMEGMLQMLTLLSYVPARRGAELPVRTDLSDPVARRIGFVPQASVAYDPRWMLAGRMNDSTWESGFFDKGSFTEIMGGWAKSIVAGRARLGGIPMGVIAVDPRTTELVRPADPAMDNSKEEVKQKAPLVWFPDSAYKTSQVILDLKAEDLPLMIFANWRGFSGGMADMFDEVLKFGSMIVDALRVYTQPVFVYLPPFATLRGGAWVVVDSKINERIIEMYASPTARGGVLEKEGTVDVKFRAKRLYTSMHRLDTQLQQLDLQLKAASGAEASKIKAAIQKRREALTPFYHAVATRFCDLHDTPGRMKAKGVIREIVPWETSREYFYWRLRHRLVEKKGVEAVERILQVDRKLVDAVEASLQPHLPGKRSEQSYEEARALLSQWIAEKTDLTGASDQEVVQWQFENAEYFETKLEGLRKQRVQAIAQAPEFLASMARLIAAMTPEQRGALQQAVGKAVEQS